MLPLFGRVAIYGVGLIGGSLGMAICARHLAEEVIGIGRNPENLSLAVELGAAHRATVDPQDGLAGAEVVVFGTPVGTTVSLLQEVLPFLSPGTVVTDVGSTKATVVRSVESLLPEGIYFVGGHPMAGSEQTGVRGADPYLFENAFYILTPTENTFPDALEKIRKMAAGLGARVIEMTPADHDLAVAAVSHLPHLAAAALVNTVTSMSGQERVSSLAAGGFRDITRIAGGDPVMWRDIFLTNKDMVLAMLRDLRHCLSDFESLLADDAGEAVLNWLALARENRARLPARIKGYLPRLFEVVVTAPDRPGSIAEFTGHLARAGLNISDIEIMRVREGEGGTIRVGFSSEREQEEAVKVLRENGFPVRKR